jgi:hypothetical protein
VNPNLITDVKLNKLAVFASAGIFSIVLLDMCLSPYVKLNDIGCTRFGFGAVLWGTVTHWSKVYRG